MVTDDGEIRGARRSSATILRHAGPVPLILDRDGGDIDAVKISLVNEGESRALVNNRIVFVPTYLKLSGLNLIRYL